MRSALLRLWESARAFAGFLLAALALVGSGFAYATYRAKRAAGVAQAKHTACKTEADKKAQEATDAIDHANPDDARARLLIKARYVLGRTSDSDAGGSADD